MEDDQAPQNHLLESVEQTLQSMETADFSTTRDVLLKLTSILSSISAVNKDLLQENTILRTKIHGFEQFWSSILQNNCIISDEKDAMQPDIANSDTELEDIVQETPLERIIHTLKDIPIMIKSLEEKQIKGANKFDLAMKSLRQHLQNKDIERKEDLVGLKKELESEILQKTGDLKETICSIESMEQAEKPCVTYTDSDSEKKEKYKDYKEITMEEDTNALQKKESSDQMMLWAKVISIVITSADQCVVLSYLPTLFQKQFGKDISSDLSFISDFVKENPLETKITGKGDNAVLWYFNNFNISSNILVNLLSNLLNECESFNATAAELSKLLKDEYEIFVDTSRVMEEALRHPGIFALSDISSGEKLIRLQVDPRIKFLFHEMAFLVRDKKQKLNNFGNLLREHLGWNFSLKSYGHTSFQDIFNSCGTSFFSISGQGNQKVVKLGIMGDLYCNMVLLLEKQNGSICLQSLGACYKKEFGKELSFNTIGYNSILDFASEFYTDFKIMGDTTSKFLVLFEAIFS